MNGVANVTMPTFTADMSQLNEQAIRFDIRLNIERGFEGTLLVSEAGTTLDEYRHFIDIAADEGAGRIQLIGHGSFNSDAEIVDAMRYGQDHGLDSYLFAFRPTFYPSTGREILDYLRFINNDLSLGCIMFAAPFWNFGRIHPSGFPIDILEDVADTENVIAIKFESIGNCAPAVLQVARKVSNRILVADPFEINAPLWHEVLAQQWLGTSQYEWYGDCIPRMWRLLKEGNFEDAMAIYWRVQPARLARASEKAAWEGAHFLHRYMWKYMAWLNGFNGGPIRMPAMRLIDRQLRTLREGLVRSGIPVTESADAEFYVGRNPV